MGKESEVDPEEEEIEDERNDDEANHSGEEVLGNTFLYRTSEEWRFVRKGAHTLSDFLQSKRSQRSIMTAMPIAITVRMPLTLEDQVQAMKKPVASIQAHQSNVNSLRIGLSVPNRGRCRLHTHW